MSDIEKAYPSRGSSPPHRQANGVPNGMPNVVVPHLNGLPNGHAHPTHPPRAPAPPATEAIDPDVEVDHDLDPPLEFASLPPLKPSETALSSRSARAALRALEDFDTSPENPRNWPSARRWRTLLTVAATGFVATCGSSIPVPGIQAAMAEFGETNERIGVLVASFYVLGMG